MKAYIGYYKGNQQRANKVELATPEYDGLMSAEDKAKLDALAEAFKELGNDVTITTIPASPTEDGLMSKEDKAKLDAIEAGANKYIHPETHPANIIVEDSDHRFVTDAEKEKWNKVVANTATANSSGLMSAEDKAKLDKIKIDGTTDSATIIANTIIQDDTHRFVTEEQLTVIENLDKAEVLVDFNDTDRSVSICPNFYKS